MKFVQNEARKPRGNKQGIFLKLDDKEAIVGILAGEPTEVYKHWVNGKPQLHIDEDCPYCKEGDEPKFSFQINFVTKENGAMVAKVLEQGWYVWKNLEKLSKEYDLDKTPIKIERDGLKQSTRYIIIPLANKMLSDSELETIKKVQLHKLEGAVSSGAEPDLNFEEGEETDGPEGGDLPF